MICEALEVVIVPFPFTDRATQKRRPAVVLSEKSFNRHGHSLMAMITSSRTLWPSDSPITNLASCGLSGACLVRLKLFTLDNRLIVRRIGRLSEPDKSQVAGGLKTILPI